MQSNQLLPHRIEGHSNALNARGPSPQSEPGPPSINLKCDQLNSLFAATSHPLVIDGAPLPSFF